ncbi:acylphosphatase [Cryobacterium luteum]|uniref:Acylphosphatase n=1 Tax=Cryobacterium luteum TaxID=1424661 RepID=A0A1H8J456_9MICO|nr:acylphosphatase [Cryobacterium luteum]TFB93315.1 hypothetical protein E3O10_03310 [Cryobacterium luteum]SEN75594.1 Acylphosphatase [Cryobacterium luteum]
MSQRGDTPQPGRADPFFAAYGRPPSTLEERAEFEVFWAQCQADWQVEIAEGLGQFAPYEALHLGLVGYARNRPDGSVELEIEGREASVSRMLLWLQTGPRYAVVTALEVSDVAATGESEFQITD